MSLRTMMITSEKAITTPTRQLEAIRDEWLAPLVAQITEQAETIGRVTAERNQAQRDRDALQVRVCTLEEQQAESPTQASSAPQTATRDATDAPWWQFWKRS